MTKITAKKIEEYKVGRLFFDIYRHLAEPDNEADWQPLCLSSTPELLSCSTRLLGQAAPPIWPGDLQCGCAFTETVRHGCSFLVQHEWSSPTPL